MTELFLVAQIAGRGVAIDTAQVSSVVDLPEIVAVPRATDAVRGLAALRSRVVTVIDTGIALGLPAMPANIQRAVITQVDGHHYALLVEALEDVAPFERLPLSSGLGLDQGWARAGIGLIERAGEPLLIIDIATLVPVIATAA